ncbi:hypothetical protein JCM15765_15010 [Paradesulfitobacterium aromaticivorans]
MIKEITMCDIKGQTKSQALTGKDIIVGPNGVGKTTRIQALGISLLGYVPGKGKLPAETFKLASSDHMTVGLVTDRLSFARTFTRSEKSGKDGANNVTVSQEITLSPSRGEKKAADKEARIAVEVGSFPVMLDFNEFLTLSDTKRREFIYSLSAIRTETWDRSKVMSYLTEHLLTTELEVNNPDQYRIMVNLISDAMKQYPESYDIQAGLQAMIDWAKAKQTHWNAEKKNAEGAVKKLADLKNQLTETDRNIVQHKAELEELQQQLTTVEAQLAQDRERKRIIDQRMARISELQEEIKKLENTIIDDNMEELDKAISEWQGRIRERDTGSFMKAQDKLLEVTNSRLETLRNQEREINLALAQVQANQEVLRQTLAKIEEIQNNRTQGQQSVCVIHPKIGCDKDFSRALDVFQKEIDQLEHRKTDQELALQELTQERKMLETNKANIEVKKNAILREQSEINQANETARKAIAELEGQKSAMANARARWDDQIRMLRTELQRLQNQPAEPIAPLDILEKQREGIRGQITIIKVKLEEQEKAKTTLSNLKSSMIDSKTATYHAQSLKDLLDSLGAKGLQGELVKGILEPIRSDIQANLGIMDIDREFYFSTESDTGKEVFQFGWRDRFGEERNFDALSTGQQLLLLIAMLVTFLDRANPPLKVLAIDNIENLDRANFRRVLIGMDKLSGKLDNIILSGVVDVYEHHWIAGTEEKTLLPELKEWGVTDLGIETIGEVKQSA